MAQPKRLVGREDIVPIDGFKVHPAAAVRTPEDFEELGYREFVRAKIAVGLASAERKTYSANSVRAHFDSNVTASED
jgi:hypothetical protein